MTPHWLFALLAGAAIVAPHASYAQASGPAVTGGVVTPYFAAFFAEYRPRTAQDMLNRLPAFDIDDGDGGRGLGQGGNVLIDGKRPTSKSDSLGEILGRLQASSIERIELIQGSAPGVDMQGYSVVANVIRRTGGGLKGSVATHVFSTGGNGGYQLEGQAQRAFGDRSLSGSFEIRDAADPREKGFRRRTAPGGTLISETDQTSVEHGDDYEATLAYETPLGPGRLRATLVGQYSTEAERGFETDLAPVPGIAELDEGGGLSRHGEIDLSYVLPLAEVGEGELTLVAQTNTDESDSYFGAQTFSQIRDSNEIVGLAAIRFNPIGRWTFSGGAEVALNTLDTVSILTGGGVNLANPAITVEELRGEAFGAARFAASPRLNLDFGLRYEVSNISTVGAAAREKTLSFPKPRFLATFARSAQEQMSLRIERRVDQLSFGDFSANVSLSNGSAPIAGNPDLEPGRAWVAEARYERRFGKQGAFTFAVAHEALEEIIVTNVFLIGPAAPPPALLPGGAYYEAADNVGDGSHTSVDVDLTLPLDRLGLPGGLFQTHLEADRTRIVDPTTGEARAFSGASPNEWWVSLSQDIMDRGFRWQIEVSNNADSDGFRPTELSRSEGEPQISVAIEQTWGPIWIRTGVNNATGEESTTYRTVYNNPRGRGVVRFLETRTESESPFFYFLVRRTF